MRPIQFITAVFILFGLSAAIQQNRSSENEIRTAIIELPKCALNCVLPLLDSMHCKLANLTSFSDCFCADIKHQKAITICAGEKCSIPDLRQSEIHLQSICAGQPFPTRQVVLYVSTIISSLLVILFVSLRCYSNYYVAKKFWWDDGFLLLSTTIFLCWQSAAFWGISYGFGLHIWNAPTSHWKGLLLFQWIWEMLYIFVQTMTKVSVLLLYHRIFPQRWFRQVLVFLTVLMFLHCIAFVIVVITACKPINSFWNKDIPGRCIHTRLVGLIGAACSIFEDVLFLLLPIPLILKLKLKLTRKIGVIMILTIGVIACAASIVRLKYLVQFKQTYDMIWDFYSLLILSQVELSLSIICVCFPAIRLLVSRTTHGQENDSSRYKSDNVLSNSTYSSRRPSKTGFLARIRSLINDHAPFNSTYIPWVSTRAPQLSSIYINSHIELSDQEPSLSDKNIKEYETKIKSTEAPEIMKSSTTNLTPFVPSGIVHVDKSGARIPPAPNTTGSAIREESRPHNRHLTSKIERKSTESEKIGKAQ